MLLSLRTVSAVLAVGALVATAGAQAPPRDGRLSFSGSWSAVGRRQALPTDGAPAAIIHLSGAVVVTTGPGSTTLGFRGEVIGYDDGRGTSTGRAVWTDARGDRVFSELKGGPLLAGRRISGTITGGSGRYAGVSGDYALTWQYVVAGEDDTVQGRTVDLAGTFRLGERGR